LLIGYIEGVRGRDFSTGDITMMTQTSLLTVTRELVPEDQRLDIVERLFGMAFPLQLEPVIYGTTDRMTEGYTGGYWHLYTLSNGGFYMAPAEDRIFHVKCQNMYEGDLSFSLSDVAGSTPGIITC
jgi:hypothetical protein